MDKLLNLSTGNFCKEIIVQDATNFSPATREDYGLALFVNVDPGNGAYTNDPTLSDLTNEGTTEVPDEWTLSIPNTTQNYEIVVFYATLWVSGTYTQGDIVFFEVDGYTGFWLKTANGTGTTEPDGITNEWSEVTGADYATFLASIAYTVESEIAYQEIVACPPYLVRLKECDGTHCIIVNTDSVNNKRYSVAYYDGTEAIAVTDMVVEDNLVCFTLPEDHIYILKIEEETSTDVWEVISYLPIYEYCKLKACATYLVDSVLCNEFDPCCDNCSQEIIDKQTRQRRSLNQILALYGSLLAYINEESIDYIGISTLEDDRLTYLERINNIFIKIKAILERCELCQGAWQTLTTTTTNSSGSYKPCNC